MRTVEHNIDIEVFMREWGRDVFIDSLDDLLSYLRAKKLNFIADKVKTKMRGDSSYKEFCVSESISGTVLLIGRCGEETLSYREIYNSEL